MDAAISLLAPYCLDKPSDVPARILYATALLDKCAQLKAAGDKTYQDTVMKPFRMGQSLITQYKYEKKILAQGYHICARGYWINDRPKKAMSYMDKTIQTEPEKDIEHYQLRAAMCLAYAQRSNPTKLPSHSKPSSSNKPVSRFFHKRQKYFKEWITLCPDDQGKAEAYFKFGQFLTAIATKREARKAFDTALALTDDEELKRKIAEQPI